MSENDIDLEDGTGLLLSAWQASYDRIGVGYSQYRRPDERIARRIESALGQSHSVLNVGAGAGSYEPNAGLVVTVEPPQR